MNRKRLKTDKYFIYSVESRVILTNPLTAEELRPSMDQLKKMLPTRQLASETIYKEKGYMMKKKNRFKTVENPVEYYRDDFGLFK